MLNPVIPIPTEAEVESAGVCGSGAPTSVGESSLPQLSLSLLLLPILQSGTASDDVDVGLVVAFLLLPRGSFQDPEG